MRSTHRWGFRIAPVLCLMLGRFLLPNQCEAQVQPADSALALRPGDAVRLRIWREPDLSGDFPVNESGVVVLPKLGPRRVGAEHPDSLKKWILNSYANYLKNPSIEVLLIRRIQVLGAVKNPGLYPVEPTMTVADAIALAGGNTPHGKSDVVELRREGQKAGQLAGRSQIGEYSIRSGDQIYVPERSWISRNPGVVISAVAVISTIVWRSAH